MEKPDKSLIEKTLGRTVTDSEMSLIDELSSKYEVHDKHEEHVPSEEETVEESIRSASDFVEEHIRPIENNPFGNISQTILSSKSVGKKIVCDYSYTEVIRDGEVVGREGGITSKTVLAINGRVKDRKIENIGSMDAIADRKVKR